MANKEYEMGSANNGRKRGPGAGRIVEKPKDFKGTFIKQIRKDCNTQNKKSRNDNHYCNNSLCLA